MGSKDKFQKKGNYIENTTDHFEKQIHLANVAPGSNVLDIGSGEGYSAFKMSCYARNVIGIDNNPKCVAKAEEGRKERGIKNVRFELGDALNINYPDEHFDVVIARGIFRHLEDYEKAIQESWRVLKPNGLLFDAEFAMPSELIPLWQERCLACSESRKFDNNWTYNTWLRILRSQKFDPIIIIPTRFERSINDYLAEIKDQVVRDAIHSKLLNIPDNLKKDMYMTSSEFTYDVVEMVLRKVSV